MRDLIKELIPHAPHLGLYVHPDLPPDRVRNALSDYARSMQPDEVVALYDGTLIGNAKDGAVFARDRFVFQNFKLDPVQEVRYADLIHVENKRKLLGGRKVRIDVNRGRATVTLTIDFSGKPDAADYVARFLNEAMLHGAAIEMDERREKGRAQTDVEAVRNALEPLVNTGRLTPDDYRKMMELLR